MTVARLLELLYGLWRVVKALLEKSRVAAVRADPADAWLRKFGGSDKRDTTSAGNPRGSGDSNMDV